MPVFQIGLDDGRSLRIEADDQAAALAGAQHFVKSDAAPSGFVADAKQGVSSFLGGVGETLSQYGAPGVGGKLKDAAGAIAPQGYKNPDVITKDGVELGNIPHAVMENAPGMAASIAAARLMPGGVIPKLLAGSGAYVLQTLGNKAKQRAVNNTGDQNAQPTTKDKIEAIPGDLAEAGVGAVGLSRFLPAGALKGVGAAGIRAALGRVGTTAAVQGAAGGAQNVVGQIGSGLGTKAGVDIDPYEAANAAATNAATGGAFAGPRGVADIATATKFRNFGGANADAVASVANDIQNKAGGKGALDPSFFNAKSGQGYDAVARAEAENKIELQRQVKDLKQSTQLPSDAEHALDRALAGETMTDADHTAIESAVKGAPNGDLVSFLARKASVFPDLQEQGDYNTSKGKFTGGMSSDLLRMVREHTGKTTLAALFGAEAGSHLIAYSPQMLAAAGLGGIGLRAASRLTGNLNPAARFINKFADPNVQAPAVVQPQATNVAPPPQAGPWGPLPPPTSVPPVQPTQPYFPTRLNGKVPAGFPAALKSNVTAINRQTRAQDRQTVQQAMPLIAKLASTQGPNAVTDLPDSFASTLSSPAPTEVPKEAMTKMRTFARSLQAIQKMKQQQLGNDQADQIAASSPLVDEVGGMGAVDNPMAGKRMSQIVSAANAIRKLTAEPKEEGAATAKVTNGSGAPKSAGEPIGKTGLDNGEPYPMSSYAQHPIERAAKLITDNAVRAGTVKFKTGFYRSTLNRLYGERTAMDLIGKEVPGLPVKELTARLEGIPDRTTAKRFREDMKKAYPKAGPAFDQYLSDAKIEELWTRKG